MNVVPRGRLSQPLENLRILLAHCPAFRAWTGAAQAEDAKRRIHLVDLPPPVANDVPAGGVGGDGSGGEYAVEELQALRPLARVDLWEPPDGIGGEPWRARRTSVNGFSWGGKLVLDFADNVRDEDAANPADCKLRFMNDVGDVLAELEAIGGNVDYLTADEIAAGASGIYITKIELFQGPLRADQAAAAAQGDHWRVQFVVHWGTTG